MYNTVCIYRNFTNFATKLCKQGKLANSVRWKPNPNYMDCWISSKRQSCMNSTCSHLVPYIKGWAPMKHPSLRKNKKAGSTNLIWLSPFWCWSVLDNPIWLTFWILSQPREGYFIAHTYHMSYHHYHRLDCTSLGRSSDIPYLPSFRPASYLLFFHIHCNQEPFGFCLLIGR